MSITTEIQRLRTNVNNIRQNTSDILDAIANKGVEIPAGSTLDDCTGLISQIGTGDENPDGSKKCLILANISNSNFLDIKNLTLFNNDKFIIKYRIYNYRGVFSIKNEDADTKFLAINDNNFYFDMNTGGGGGSWGAGPSPAFSDTLALKTLTIQYNENNTGSDQSDVSLEVNGVTSSSKWGPSSSWGYGKISCNTLRLFEGRIDNAYRSGIMDFFELSIYSDQNVLKYKFTPAEKEGIAGVYEEVNNTFYGETYHDNTIFCI